MFKVKSNDAKMAGVVIEFQELIYPITVALAIIMFPIVAGLEGKRMRFYSRLRVSQIAKMSITTTQRIRLLWTKLAAVRKTTTVGHTTTMGNMTRKRMTAIIRKVSRVKWKIIKSKTDTRP